MTERHQVFFGRLITDSLDSLLRMRTFVDRACTLTSSYQYGDTLKCFDSMDGYLWGHRASGASRERIIWIIRGMSFAMKYLPAIRTIGAGKGQSAGETRNRNR